MPSIRTAFAVLFLVFTATELPAAEAASLYAQGAYEAAIEAGEAEGDAEGLANAGRAALVDAELRETPCLSCLERAEDFARRAIMADPSRPDVYITLVAALGRRSRLIGFFQSRSEDIAGQADEAIAQSLMLDPNFSWALAARGGWHIEVVRQAGRILGSVLFGADVEEGKDYFRSALAAEPDNLVISYQLALTLSAYDLDGEREEIENALQAASAAAPRDAYEVAIAERAATLQSLLNVDDEEAFRERLNEYLGNP